jgi:uncharacterized protein with gpF-like domain
MSAQSYAISRMYAALGLASAIAARFAEARSYVALYRASGAQDNFTAKVNDLIQQARQLTPAVRKQVFVLLEEARQRIVGQLSNIDPASYTAAQLRTLKLDIDRALAQFGQQLSGIVNGAQSDAYNLGSATVTQPLESLGLPAPSFAGVSDSALAIAQGYTADLITGLAQDAAAKVNAAIQRAFLGGQSIGDIIGQVGRGLAGDKFTGLFSTIGERAESIALNEILRVHSIAAQSRMEDLRESLPGLQKQWLHVPAARVPRLTHIMASGDVVNVDEPFIVGGEELMFPRDPGGSAGNTINCHCLVRPFMSSSSLQSTLADKSLLGGLGLSVTAG